MRHLYLILISLVVINVSLIGQFRTEMYGSGECGANAGIPQTNYAITPFNPAWLNVSNVRMYSNILFGNYDTLQIPLTNLKEIGIIIPLNKYGITAQLFTGVPLYNLTDSTSNPSYLKWGNVCDTLLRSYGIQASIKKQLPLGSLFRQNTARIGVSGILLGDYKNYTKFKAIQIKAGGAFTVRPIRPLELSAGVSGQVDNAGLTEDLIVLEGQVRYFPETETTRMITLSAASLYGLDFVWAGNAAAMNLSTGNYHPVTATFGLNVHRIDPLSSISPVVDWFNVGLSSYFGPCEIALSYRSALNINRFDADDFKFNKLEDNKTVASSQLISLHVSIPLFNKLRVVKHLNTYKPDILQFNYSAHPIHLGTTDTLEFWVRGEALTPVKENYLYLNVEPKYGVVLEETNREITTIQPGEEYHIPVAVKSLANYESQNFMLSVEAPYQQEKSVVASIPFKTVGPSFRIEYDFIPSKKFIFFRENNGYFFDINIVNTGSTFSDGMKIFLDYAENGAEYIITDTVMVGKISPGISKKARISVRTIADKLPPRIHFSLVFKEKNGFDPQTYSGDFVVQPDNQVMLRLRQYDPFVSNFVGYRRFFLVSEPNLEEFQNSSRFNNNSNPKFPGFNVQEYASLSAILTRLLEIENKKDEIWLYGEKDGIISRLDRYFLKAANNDQNAELLLALPDVMIYKDRNSVMEDGLMIGPFLNVNEAASYADYLKSGIAGELSIVKRYVYEIEKQ